MLSTVARRATPLRRVLTDKSNIALARNVSVRFISSTSPRLDGTPKDIPSPVTEEAAKLSSSSSMGDLASAVSEDGIVSVVNQLGYNPFDLACLGLENIHLALDIPYWQAIVVGTIAVRLITLPIGIKSMQNSSRLAALRPHMAKLSENAKKDPGAQSRYTTELYALWKKYKVNPLKAAALPFVQLPIFISLFFGLKQMGSYYPEFANGGAYWFTDLAAADPTMVLPVINAASFLLMFEMNADGFQTENNDMFKMAMRGLSLAMVPLTYQLPAGIFVYWCTNNALSVIQGRVLKIEAIANYLDIPKAPVAAPAFKMSTNPVTKFIDAIRHPEKKVEVVDGSAPRTPTPTVTPTSPPPKTFTGPPPTSQKKKKKSVTSKKP